MSLEDNMGLFDIFKIEELKNNIIALEKERDALTKQHQEIKIASETKQKELESKISKAEAENHKKSARIDELQKELSTIAADFEAKIQKADAAQRSVIAENEELRANLSDFIKGNHKILLDHLKKAKILMDEIDIERARLLFEHQLSLLSQYSASSHKSFLYEITEKGVVIKNYIGQDKDVIVPEFIDGAPVYRIHNDAFRECKEVESIHLPNTIKEIGKCAFYGCGVKEINLPEGIETLEKGSLKDADQLTNLTFPSTIKTIPEKCCSVSGNIVIKGAVNIEHHALFCGGTIVLPETLQIMTGDAISGVNKLIIPHSVEKVKCGTYMHDFNKMHVAFLNDETDVEFPSLYSYERQAEKEAEYEDGDPSYYTPPVIYCNIGSKAHISARNAKLIFKPLSEFPKDDIDTTGFYHFTSNSNFEELDTSSWNLESILRQEGYTVSQKEDLSDYDRQQILLSVMRRNLMSKWQIIEHIELQISLRRNNRMYSIAISKWERDLSFLRKL